MKFMKVSTVLAVITIPNFANAASEIPSKTDDLVVIEADEVLVTATRRTRKKLDIPETVDVISRKQLDDQNITNLQDLVRHLPGVSVTKQTSGTDPFGNFGGFTIRGASANRVQMQVDGSRVIESITDGNRSFIDLSTMKAVEVIRGPGSVLWGADALGGVVAFRTLDPSDLLKGESFAGRANLGYDSLNEQYSQTGMLAAQFSEKTQGLLSVTHRSYKETELRNARADGGIWGCPRVEDAIRCNELNPLDADVYNILAKFVWNPNANHQVKLTGEYFSSDSDVKQLYDYGRQLNGSFNGDYLRNQKQTRTRVALEDLWLPETNLIDEVKWQLSYSPQKRNVSNNRTQINTWAQKVETYTHTNYQEDFLQADIQLSSSFNAGSTSHQLTYGFQGDQTKTDYDNLTVTKNRTTGSTVIKPAGGFNFANATTNRADLYIQDEIKLFGDRLTITPGVRWATYQIKPETNKDYIIIPGKEPKTIDSEKLIPQLGLMVGLTNNYSLYGRYAEGFKMPTAQQLFTSLSMGTTNLIPNPNLKAETVKSYEAGVRGQFKNGWFSLGAFQADYSNYIQSFVSISPTDMTYANLAEVNIWGIEASAEWQVATNWAFNAAASYQYGTQKEKADATETYFNGASPLNGTLGVRWTKPEWRFDAEFVGTFAKGVTRTASSSNYKPAGYGVFDSYFNWKLNNNLTLRASVQNIFDRRYFKAPLASTYDVAPSSATRISNPLELQTAPGRSFALDIAATF